MSKAGYWMVRNMDRALVDRAMAQAKSLGLTAADMCSEALNLWLVKHASQVGSLACETAKQDASQPVLQGGNAVKHDTLPSVINALLGGQEGLIERMDALCTMLHTDDLQGRIESLEQTVAHQDEHTLGGFAGLMDSQDRIEARLTLVESRADTGAVEPHAEHTVDATLTRVLELASSQELEAILAGERAPRGLWPRLQAAIDSTKGRGWLQAVVSRNIERFRELARKAEGFTRNCGNVSQGLQGVWMRPVS